MPSEAMDVDELVGHVVEAARVSTDAALRHNGGVMPPTVFILNEQLDTPLVAHVVVRPFYPGDDAEAAIVALGVLPAQLGATRLVVAVELQDLRAAIGASSDPDKAALVVTDAGLEDQCVHWYPLGMCPAPDWAATGAVTPEWGVATRLPGQSAPPPIDELLDTWKQLRAEAAGVGVDETARAMATAGYKIQWLTC